MRVCVCVCVRVRVCPFVHLFVLLHHCDSTFGLYLQEHLLVVCMPDAAPGIVNIDRRKVAERIARQLFHSAARGPATGEYRHPSLRVVGVVSGHGDRVQYARYTAEVDGIRTGSTVVLRVSSDPHEHSRLVHAYTALASTGAVAELKGTIEPNVAMGETRWCVMLTKYEKTLEDILTHPDFNVNRVILNPGFHRHHVKEKITIIHVQRPDIGTIGIVSE